MKKIIDKASLALLVFFPAAALAYTAPPVNIKKADTTDVPSILGTIIDKVLLLVGGITVLFIIYAGILYVTAAGNKDRIEQAKQTLTYAVIGLIVIVLADVIVRLAMGLPASFGLTN